MEDELDLGAGPATIKDAGYTPVWEVTPTISRGQQEKEEATKAANDTFLTSVSNLPDTVSRSFRSGGNVGYQVYRQLDRAIDAGPVDDQWRQGLGAEWAERQKIPHAERWRYTTARNQAEAEALFEDKQLWAKDAAVLSERTGLLHTVASMLPGIIDIDTPLTLGAGALLSGAAKAAINASKFSRITAGGVGGAVSGAGLGLVQDASDPNADWTVIPLYALAGTAFGAAGGAFGRTSKLANAERDRTLNEFGETLADNMPRANKENLHMETFGSDDNYFAEAARRDIEAFKVEQEAVAKTAASEGAQAAARKPTAVNIDEIETQDALGSGGISDDPRIQRRDTGIQDVAAYDEMVSKKRARFNKSVEDSGKPRQIVTLYHGKQSPNLRIDPDVIGVGNSGKTWLSPNASIAGEYSKATRMQIDPATGAKSAVPGQEPTVFEMNVDVTTFKTVNGRTLLTEKAKQDAIATARKEGYPGVRFTNMVDRAGMKWSKLTTEDQYYLMDYAAVQDAKVFGESKVFQAGETSPDAGSIGARNQNLQGPGIASITNKKHLDMTQHAQTRVRQLGIADTWEDAWRNVPQYAEGVAKQAERFANFVNRSWIGSDFAKMMNSGSAVFQMAAYDLMENAVGIVRNGRSAARIYEHYNKQLGSAFIPFNDAFAEYATAGNHGMFSRMFNTDLKQAFNREVAAELAARFHDLAGKAPKDSPVWKAANAIDNTFAREVDISKGRPGETPLYGTDTLTKKSGYVPQKWAGVNMRKLISTGKRKKSDIVLAIQEAYLNTYKHMDKADAKTYATAVVDRALRRDEGISSNMIGLLQADGREELMDFLVRQQNMDARAAEKFIDRMKGTLEERGKQGWTKNRLDVDMRFTSSNGLNMMDLMDIDFSTFVPARIRKSAGLSALARKGIASKQDWNDMVEAGLAEQQARGKAATGTGLRDRVDSALHDDAHVTREFMENLYSYFNGQPLAGGMSPMYSRMKKLTNLALLNQLGVTQLAELGPTMASVGLESFFRHAGEALTGSLRKVDSPLVKELKHMDILVPEEKLFRADLVHEFEKSSTQNEYIRGLDRLLNKGQYIQGYTSGFNAMRNIQQRIAVTSAADQLAKYFRDGKGIRMERLRDMGMDHADIAKLRDYVTNGTVQFDANGNLVKLNLDKWAPEDSELFAMTLNQRTNTLVQKAMAGESSMLFHKDGVASLFWHLKSFPMLALEKQALRNARLMDTEAAMTFMYGLGTAAAAYTVRQTINGRTDRLNFEDIAKGAFGYSNMTGWIPMWTDPLAGMLGMDNLMVGGYAGQGSVIAVPAALPTLDRMARIPGAVLDAGDLDLSNRSINALSAGPLFGNAYGFGLMWSLMRNDNTAKKEAARKEAQKAKEDKIKQSADPLKEAIRADGWADPDKYIQNNLDDGLTLDDIKKQFNLH